MSCLFFLCAVLNFNTFLFKSISPFSIQLSTDLYQEKLNKRNKIRKINSRYLFCACDLIAIHNCILSPENLLIPSNKKIKKIHLMNIPFCINTDFSPWLYSIADCYKHNFYKMNRITYYSHIFSTIFQGMTRHLDC